MKIDRNLNITFEVAGIPSFHTPLSFALFQQHSVILSEFFSKTVESYFVHSGIAHSLFVSLYTDEDGKLIKKADNLLKDLTRTTFFYVAGKGSPIGFETAVNDKLLDEEDLSEVLSKLLFFTEAVRLNCQTMDALNINLNRYANSSTTLQPLMDWHSSLLTAKDSEPTPTTG